MMCGTIRRTKVRKDPGTRDPPRVRFVETPGSVRTWNGLFNEVFEKGSLFNNLESKTTLHQEQKIDQLPAAAWACSEFDR